MSNEVLAAWGAFLRPSFDQVMADAGVQVIHVPGDKSPAEVAPNADALYVRLPQYASAEVIAGMPRLRVLAVPGAGLEVVDVVAATQRGIPVLSGIGMGPQAVAEWTIGSMLWLVRDMGAMHEAMRSGNWKRRFDVADRRDIRTLTIGVIGYGQIGRRVAQGIKSAFGSRVIVNDLLPERMREAQEHGLETMEIDDLVRASDIVTLHTQAIHGEPPTIDRRRIGLFKPTAFVVNTTRGAVLDYEALMEALDKKALAGAALDVYPQEPPPQEFVDRLASYPRVLLSPHQGGMTIDALEVLATGVASSIVDVLRNGRPWNCANPEVWKNWRINMTRFGVE
jgi:D-3-phosphoglycerate dehydrogenase